MTLLHTLHANVLWKAVTRRPWFTIALWITLSVVLTLTAPDLTKVASENEGDLVPNSLESVQAMQKAQEAFPDLVPISRVILGLRREEGLTRADREFAATIQRTLSNESPPVTPSPIIKVNGPDSKPEIAQFLASADARIQLVDIPLNASWALPKTRETLDWIRRRVEELPAPDGLEMIWTGDAVLGVEYMQAVQTTLDRAAVATVILLTLVLMFVYRSIWLTIVPMLTIGISFLISRGILGFLSLVGWEVTMLVELFLIVVLFGSGTDLCLFLTWRFGERWTGEDAPRELRSTLRRAAWAVISSAGTAIIALLLMSFNNFKLFSRTGPSVALGLTVGLAASLTLCPALLTLMARYHPKAFRDFKDHRPRFWHWVGDAVLRRPLVCWLVCLAVMIPPALFFFRVQTTNNMLAELPRDTPSQRGVDLIDEVMGKGTTSPWTVILKTRRDTQRLDNSLGLATIDDFSQLIARKTDWAARVRSATQPLGDQTQLEQARLLNRLTKIHQGVGELENGTEKIGRGLRSEVFKRFTNTTVLTPANSKRTSDPAPRDPSWASTASLPSDRAASDDPDQKEAKAARPSPEQNRDSSSVGASLARFFTQRRPLAASPPSHKTPADDPAPDFPPAILPHPDAETIPESVDVTTTTNLNRDQNSLAPNHEQPRTLDDHVRFAAGSEDEPSLGRRLAQMMLRVAPLTSDPSSASASTPPIAPTTPTPSQPQAATASEKGSQSQKLEELIDGITRISNGIKEVNSQIGVILRDPSAPKFLKRLLISEQDLSEFPQIRASLDAFISPTGHLARIEVAPLTEPYSAEARQAVEELRRELKALGNDHDLVRVDVEVTGPDALSLDLQGLTRTDQRLAYVIIPLGIFAVLWLAMRDIGVCVNLVGTMALTYMVSMGLTYLVFVGWLGSSGVDWKVPYFLFVLLLAIGVDYNIFLMTRIREETKLHGFERGIALGIGTTGALITSAALITVVSFACFMLSPLSSIRQLGFALVVGITIDALVVRPVLMPCGHWLLERYRAIRDEDDSSDEVPPVPEPTPAHHDDDTDATFPRPRAIGNPDASSSASTLANGHAASQPGKDHVHESEPGDNPSALIAALLRNRGEGREHDNAKVSSPARPQAEPDGGSSR